jgi:hypothetical protein
LKLGRGWGAAAIAIFLCFQALPASAVWPFDTADHPDPADDLAGAASQILSHAIQFKTANPPGDERPLAEYLVGLLKARGIEAEVIETPRMDDCGSRRGVARVKGNGRSGP